MDGERERERDVRTQEHSITCLNITPKRGDYRRDEADYHYCVSVVSPCCINRCCFYVGFIEISVVSCSLCVSELSFVGASVFLCVCPLRGPCRYV